MVKMTLPQNLIIECKHILLQEKAMTLNRLSIARTEHQENTFGGDEADQTNSVLAEKEFLTTQNRMRKKLFEIEAALARIEKGMYGVCEETEENIETNRLLSIPWTRLSIEGAEIQESMKKRYAKY